MVKGVFNVDIFSSLQIYYVFSVFIVNVYIVLQFVYERLVVAQ